jgi:hypothetical protein
MAKKRTSHTQHQKPMVENYEAAFVDPDQKLLTFAIPDGANSQQQKLAADIVVLDHRAHWRLRAGSPEWEEVIGLLANAANLGVISGQPTEARAIYQEALSAFEHHNQTKNRIRYLCGALIGVLAAALLATAFFAVSRFWQPFISPQFLILIFLFAGIGSITSVLTRIGSIDLRKEISDSSVVISGAARPVVAIFLALLVYLILETKIVDIKFGNPSDGKVYSVYLISSFLCGFSERFASDIISRVPFAKQNPENNGKG